MISLLFVLRFCNLSLVQLEVVPLEAIYEPETDQSYAAASEYGMFANTLRISLIGWRHSPQTPRDKLTALFASLTSLTAKQDMIKTLRCAVLIASLLLYVSSFGPGGSFSPQQHSDLDFVVYVSVPALQAFLIT